MTDLVLFVKATPKGQELPWPRPTELRDVDLPAEFRCAGADPLCSSGYRKYVESLRDSAGRALPNLLARVAPGVDPDRVAFVGFSAAHGLLDALAVHPEDRERISAYLLLDATFASLGATSTKPGYVALGKDAARGDALLVSATSDAGGVDFMAADEAFALVWRDIGESRDAPVLDPMPVPARGPFQIGDGAFWYDYGGMLGHGEIGQLAEPMMEAYLLPHWSGTLDERPRRRRGLGGIIVGTLLAALAVWAAATKHQEE